MAQNPEEPQRYVCKNCQITHAGMSAHNAGDHQSSESPTRCGRCGESTFVPLNEWAHHHE